VIQTLTATYLVSFGDQYKLTDSRNLSIESPATWDDVAQFYKSELPKSNWQPISSAAVVADSLGQAWQRGAQRFTIARLVGSGSARDILVLTLTTKQ